MGILIFSQYIHFAMFIDICR